MTWKYRSLELQIGEGATSIFPGRATLETAWIPAVPFMTGPAEDDKWRFDDEDPKQEVTADRAT